MAEKKNHHDDTRSEWAEEMPEFAPGTIIYEGEESRAALADLLDGEPAVGGPDEVGRRLRGRPGLDPTAPAGTKARQLNVRIGAELNELLVTHVRRSGFKNESDLVRTALTEYFTNHKLSA